MIYRLFNKTGAGLSLILDGQLKSTNKSNHNASIMQNFICATSKIIIFVIIFANIMCLAVPGKILSITDDGLFKMAEVDFCGVKRPVSVDTVEDVRPGDYVIAHAGVAISVMDEECARHTIADLEKMAQYRDEHFGEI